MPTRVCTDWFAPPSASRRKDVSGLSGFGGWAFQPQGCYFAGSETRTVDEPRKCKETMFVGKKFPLHLVRGNQVQNRASKDLAPSANIATLFFPRTATPPAPTREALCTLNSKSAVGRIDGAGAC